MGLVKEIGPWAPSTFNVLRKQNMSMPMMMTITRLYCQEEDAAEVHMYICTQTNEKELLYLTYLSQLLHFRQLWTFYFVGGGAREDSLVKFSIKNLFTKDVRCQICALWTWNERRKKRQHIDTHRQIQQILQLNTL